MGVDTSVRRADPYLMEQTLGTPSPSTGRLIVAALGAGSIPWIFAGIAVAFTDGRGWETAASEGFAMVLALLWISRLVKGRARLVIGLGWGIPAGLMFLGGLIAYLRPRPTALHHLSGWTVLWFGIVWVLGLLVALAVDFMYGSRNPANFSV